MDVGIGDAGAVGKRRDGVGRLVLDEGQHVGCGLTEVVVSCDFGERHIVREPVDGEGVSDAEGAWDVAFVAAVVLGGRADVPAIDTVRCHVGSLIGCYMDNDSGAWWCERAFVEIEIAVEAGIG